MTQAPSFIPPFESHNSITNCHVNHGKLIGVQTYPRMTYTNVYYVRLRNNVWQRSVCINKVHPRTDHVGPEGKQRYSSTLTLTSAPDMGGCSTPRPGRCIPRKQTRYQLYRRLAGPQGRSGRAREISPHRDSTPGMSSP